jgi:hypothetical protein
MITLKTLEFATAQEVFDQAVEHLRKQGKRSALDSEYLKAGCKYRSEDGLKCAAGCFIADDEYDPRMEGKGWGGEMFPKVHVSLMITLQKIHDDYYPSQWEREFQRAAENFELVLKPMVLRGNE